MGDAAIALNPYDADMAGFLGLFKLTCGMGPEGELLLRRSLQLDSSYPGVPAVTLAFTLSQRGEQDEARRILDHMPSPSNMELYAPTRRCDARTGAGPVHHHPGGDPARLGRAARCGCRPRESGALTLRRALRRVAPCSRFSPC